MTLVNFGFSTLLLSLLLEACYSWGIVTLGLLKRVLHMGTSENKIAKNVNFKGYEQECQIIIVNKPQISVAFNLFTISIISVIFCKKGNYF